MLKVNRHNEIMEILKTKDSILVTELSEIFNCSDETIRRDLKELEDKKLLTRVHGGAFITKKYDKTYPSDIRNVLYLNEKKQISKVALEFIEENDFIYLDSSTTCLQLANMIIESKKNITILTNSLSIANHCCKVSNNVDLIMIGGKLRSNNKSVAGIEGIDQIKNYHADKSFISPPKVNLSEGIFDNDIFESKIRERMIQSSDKAILLIDHTKFYGTSNYQISGLEKVDTIITDKLPNKKNLSIIDDYSINCLIAD